MKTVEKIFYALIFVALLSFAGSSVDAKENEQININKATVKELLSLKGIGSKKANDIIVYRDEHGPYTEIEEIMKIKGIGDKMFEKIKDQITVRE
ncbi:MAG: ComEA family DNA-binding protein [Candidatus Scalindua sp.]|nr:ComEA family DNA-binding protein [Candidatus Scalindua sp.]